MNLWGIIKGLLIQDETDRSKELSLEVDPAATTNTRTIVKSAQTANRTISMPDASDTLMGKATIDILTNKTFDADGTGNVLSNVDDSNIKALAGIDASKLADGSVSNAEYQFISSLSSNAQDQLDANAQAITDHITDLVDAHDASAISNIPSGNLVATDVQSALDELQSDVDTRALNSALTDHINDAVDAHDASSISVIPTGNLTSTEVQAALVELQTEIDGFSGGGANTALSNLIATSINQDLVPNVHNTRGLGTPLAQWANTNTFRVTNTSISGAEIFSSGQLAGLYVGAPASGAGISLFDSTGAWVLYNETRPNSTADANPTSNIVIRTGNKTAGTGNSGNISLQPGTSAGGTRGKINFADGSEGSSGDIWTSTDSTGNGAWVTPSAPTVTTYTSGSGTYNTPVGVRWIKIRAVGAGGGGSGNGSGVSRAGGDGGDTTFDTLVASGGVGGDLIGGAGGGAVNGDINISGVAGSSSVNIALYPGMPGGGSVMGPGGGGGGYPVATPLDGVGAILGGGGGGGFGDGGKPSGSGGGGGGYFEKLIASPASSYSYSVGAGGTMGSGTGATSVGGSGGSGIIIIEEFY